MRTKNCWRFLNNNADFELESPDSYSYLYFPLANEAGMMSSITPTLGGDAKTGQSSFLLLPVSAEDLHTSRSTRNFWVYCEGKGAWSATGISVAQIASREKERSRLEAGFLWHKLERENPEYGLKSEITTFVPCENDTVELTKVEITNISKNDIEIIPTAAIPIYGRSADNIRDHRHVTSLLGRTAVCDYGILTSPTLIFDETGHRICKNTYGVFGSDGCGGAPDGFFADVESFIGEGGTLDWPESVVFNREAPFKPGDKIDGYEVMGALRFKKAALKPGEKAVYIIALCINPEGIPEKYLNKEKFNMYLEKNKKFWNDKLNLRFHTNSIDFDRWMKWVTAEPILRRIFGCSFLPHHDYGRGGKGWRDLWQDCLSLILMEPANVGTMLLDNCAGMRFDGTNATIIGDKRGEFKADRNNITRVWMDHAAWPLNTVEFYINQTGDLDLLFKKQTYFRDSHIRRGKAIDPRWTEATGTIMLCKNNKPYYGTILEHLLIENLTASLNVGDHGVLRLENADWNDALDMASEKGESVAFTSMYCGNLKILSNLLLKLKEERSIQTIEIAKEAEILFNPLPENTSPAEMKNRLFDFCGLIDNKLSGITVDVQIDRIVKTLQSVYRILSKNIAKNEIVKSSEGFEWLNGYYDNNGRAVEGEFNGRVRMTLTGQVFAIMYDVVDKETVKKIIQAADRYLFDKEAGGYRLNTDFGELKTDLGRQFGFAFGHKENGAVFSHMAVMYANALYKRGFVREGFKVLNTLCRHCMDFERSLIYPGIPEYINTKGRGMYHYLTGAASWLTLTFVTEIFGIKGSFGDLVFAPKLVAEQFDEQGCAVCETIFGGRSFRIIYHNKEHLDYGSYRIGEIKVDGIGLGKMSIASDEINKLSRNVLHTVEITLERM